MKYKLLLCLLLFLLSLNLVKAQDVRRPKLVVGIVVDQMRWDYLYRFYERYGNGGFKRLMREGFNCENTFIPFTPTYTAPGHASIYTGSVPALHGIMGNSWYDKQSRKVVYCTDDDDVVTVGSRSVAGKMSPKNMWPSTVTDELRLATNFRSKVIAIALKDRASILPGGHSANASYWFDNASGGWISSSFYMKDLPQWVKDFNSKKLPDVYLKQPWNTLFPISTYQQSTSDSNAYESRLPGEDNTFPHRTDTVSSNKYETFRYTPGANSYTFEMAKATIRHEQLGKRNVTDFLALSFSSPDYIGHNFGPNSIEVEDTYLRFDRELENFLKHLDQAIGKGQYLLFLTADHGTAHNPTFLKDEKIPAGTYDHAAIRREMTDSLLKRFGTAGIIAHAMNYQVFLNDSIIAKAGLHKDTVKQYITGFLMKHPVVVRVIDLARIGVTSLPPAMKMIIENGYNQKLSGDLQVIIKPQWYEGTRTTGTSHGQWNPYDARIPLLWFGWNIRPGVTHRQVYMTDIAPTVSALLHIQKPNAAVGEVIQEVIR